MIQMTQELESGAVLIQIEDRYTRQNIVLTPAEAADLRDKLNHFDLSEAGDEYLNHSARRWKGLAVYNGACEPFIDREKFEVENPGPMGPDWFDGSSPSNN